MPLVYDQLTEKEVCEWRSRVRLRWLKDGFATAGVTLDSFGRKCADAQVIVFPGMYPGTIQNKDETPPDQQRNTKIQNKEETPPDQQRNTKIQNKEEKPTWT